MIGNFIVNPTYLTPERFFVEKLAEHIHPKTLDSYRVRLNNPKASLAEVKFVLTDFHNNKIKHFDKTVRPVLDEAAGFIDQDDTLDYGKVNKDYYKQLLKDSKQADYHSLFYATNAILKVNQNYLEKLCGMVEAEIARLVAQVTPLEPYELIKLDGLIEFLATELVNSGYSKSYLFRTVLRRFGNGPALAFPAAYQHVKELSTRPAESYDVIFRLAHRPSRFGIIQMHDSHALADDEIEQLKLLNAKALGFFNRRTPYSTFLKITEAGKDFMSVVDSVNRKILPKLDLLHMGFPDTEFFIDHSCLVIGVTEPQQANIQPIRFVTDGQYRNHQQLYDDLQHHILALEANSHIQKETIQKIVSAVRHLRLGSEASELEQIFINYWIGLEYIFSNYDVGESTINRLKDGFINAHSISYLKRNLIEFSRDISRLGLQAQIPGFNADLQFLQQEATYNHIMATFLTSHPLLAFRASQFKALLTGTERMEKAIAKHRTNLDRHLTRCYRVRNEIVHDAAIHLNIGAITANLKYYLTFIINDCIAFLINNPMDLNLSGRISLEDYFIYQSIRMKGLEKARLTFVSLANEESVTAVFTE